MRSPKFPPAVDEEDEARRLNACAALTTELIDDVEGVWFLRFVVHFGGEPYEYLVEAARGRGLTVGEVEYRLSAFGVRERLQERFLREVKLEIMQ